MRDFLAVTRAFVLALAVHLLMAAVVVLSTLDWRPFKPPILTGMTIEAVMVDTNVIKQRRAQARREAEQAIAKKVQQERRAQELKARQEREAREQLAEEKRQQEQVLKKREEDLRLRKLRQKQQQERQDRLDKRQQELEDIRRQREIATRQRIIEEEKLKQLEARRKADAHAQRLALAKADLQRQLSAEQVANRAGEIASLGLQYYAAIQAQVTNNWLRPPTAKSGLKCTLRIVQIPGGEVISAAIAGACNADEATRRSLLAAVERAGSLPYRGFEDVFDREIDFIFRYDGD